METKKSVSFSRSPLIEGVASVTVSALVTTESLTGLQCSTVDVGAYPTGDFKLTECGSSVDLTGMQTEASEPVWMNPFWINAAQRCWTLPSNFFASSSGSCILFSTCLPRYISWFLLKMKAHTVFLSHFFGSGNR